MTDLISQLFDIATNEEFSPEQRRELMAVAMTEQHITSIPGPNEADVVKYMTVDQYRSAVADGITSLARKGAIPTSVIVDYDIRFKQPIVYVLGYNGMDRFTSRQEIDTTAPSPSSLNIDAALGRHLTKETLPNGGIRFGLASQLPSD